VIAERADYLAVITLSFQVAHLTCKDLLFFYQVTDDLLDRLTFFWTSMYLVQSSLSAWEAEVCWGLKLCCRMLYVSCSLLGLFFLATECRQHSDGFLFFWKILFSVRWMCKQR